MVIVSSRGGPPRPLCSISGLVVFLIGFAVRHMIDVLLPSRGSANAKTGVAPEISQRDASNSAALTSTYNQGVYPLMRDFRCGHANLETPRALKDMPGRGRVVVDVGLDEGQEMLDAVQNGFVVFGFEMLTGSMVKIKSNAEGRGILDKLHFVEFAYDEKRGIPVAKDLPTPPGDGSGFAYVFNAGVSDEVGSMRANMGSNSVAMMKDNSINEQWSAGMVVPILRLDQALPDWVKQIFFLKIDTQGHELKVLKGASNYLRSGQVQYAQYEFSPKLMRTARSGDPFELLQLMLSMGALCFDMMGAHHDMTRPSAPLAKYWESIDSGKNSSHPQARKNNYATDPIGPWDDILCWFPEATG